MSTISGLDLSNSSDVTTYLSQTPFASTLVTALTGGTGNYVFRLHLQVPHKGKKTLVLKHGKPYVKDAQRIPFDIARQLFEVEALRRVGAWLASEDGRAKAGSIVTVPEVHLFDEEAHVIIMDDAGEGFGHLKEYMKKTPSEGGPTAEMAARIGTAIGRFLGEMHEWGRGNAELLEVVQRSEMARMLSGWVFYGRLLDVLRTGPKLVDPPLELEEGDVDVMEELVKETQETMLATRDSFVMGDFWPGNIMVIPDESGNLKNIVVLDWELTKTGQTGIEVGQFCAEIHLLRRCIPEKCEETATLLLNNFFKEYASACKPTANVARRAVVQWGAHMAILAEIWGGRELTRAVVKEGIRIMVDGYTCKEADLRNTVVGPLLAAE